MSRGPRYRRSACRGCRRARKILAAFGFHGLKLCRRQAASSGDSKLPDKLPGEQQHLRAAAFTTSLVADGYLRLMVTTMSSSVPTVCDLESLDLLPQ